MRADTSTARTDRFRCAEWRDQPTGQVRARELYDHGRDPGEHQSVIDDPAYAQHLPTFQALLAELMTTT